MITDINGHDCNRYKGVIKIQLFFNTTTTHRRRRNRIVMITNENGRTQMEEIMKVFVLYFKNLYQTQKEP
jgi:hypothetical protein